MQLKPIVQGLAAIWLVLFVASFFALRVATTEDDPSGGLGRIVAFLTWQALAFAVGVAGAVATRFAVSRGTEKVKLVGYTPLAVSVFLLASFIAMVAFRFYVVPLFDAA
jgi:hypothetical protein